MIPMAPGFFRPQRAFSFPDTPTFAGGISRIVDGYSGPLLNIARHPYGGSPDTYTVYALADGSIDADGILDWAGSDNAVCVQVYNQLTGDPDFAQSTAYTGAYCVEAGVFIGHLRFDSAYVTTGTYARMGFYGDSLGTTDKFSTLMRCWDDNASSVEIYGWNVTNTQTDVNAGYFSRNAAGTSSEVVCVSGGSFSNRYGQSYSDTMKSEAVRCMVWDRSTSPYGFYYIDGALQSGTPMTLGTHSTGNFTNTSGYGFINSASTANNTNYICVKSIVVYKRRLTDDEVLSISDHLNA